MIHFKKVNLKVIPADVTQIHFIKKPIIDVSALLILIFLKLNKDLKLKSD